MARTPFLQRLQRRANLQAEAVRTGRDPRAIEEEAALRRERQEPGSGLGRRTFLAAGAAAAVGSMLPWRRVAAAPPGGTQPRIAIIGGGMAGLSAAVTLADYGYASTIYEAQWRVGGRMLSERSGSPTQPACGTCHNVNNNTEPTWLDGQYTDVFAELIDTGHLTMRAFADRFGLPLVDSIAWEPPGATETYHFFGNYYRKEDADADFAALWPTIRADLNAAGYPTTWDWSKPAGRALDAMSIYDWIETRVPGGHDNPLGSLLDVAYNIEFGAESRDQSALNLLYLLGYSPSHRIFNVFGESDERYRLEGGIDRLTTAMGASLPQDSINLGWFLESLALRSDGTYALSFGKNGEVIADIVLLTVPFAVLRDMDTSLAGFDALKNTTIQELGRGHNGKHHIQFSQRLWNMPNPAAWRISGGTTYSDTGYQVSWDTTRGQAGQSGIMAFYTGGDVTDALSLKHSYGDWRDAKVMQDTALILQQAEPVFPGLSALWNGRATGSMPHVNPFWKCSYSYWRVGQYQTIAGYERVRQGNVFFAGEHTSVDFQGWMEGAASEGVRAAKEIVSGLKGH